MNFLKISKFLLLSALIALVGFEAPILSAQRGKKRVMTKKHAMLKKVQSRKAQPTRKGKSRKPVPQKAKSRKPAPRKPSRKISPREQADIQRAKRLSLLQKAKKAIQPKPKPGKTARPVPALAPIPGANIINDVVDHQGANAECGYNAEWNGVNGLKEIRGEEHEGNRVNDIAQMKAFIRDRRGGIAQAEAAKAPKVTEKPAVEKKKPVVKGKRKPVKRPIKKVPAKPTKPAPKPRPNDQWLDDGEVEELVRQFSDLQPQDFTVIKGLHQLNPNNEVGFENIADVIRALRADPNASHLFILGNMHYQIVPAHVIQPSKGGGKSAKGLKKQAAVTKALKEQADTAKAEVRGIPGHWIAVVAQGDNYHVRDSGAPGQPNATAYQLIRILRNANPDALDFAATHGQLIDAVNRNINDGNIADALTGLEEIINQAAQFNLLNAALRQNIRNIVNRPDVALLTEGNDELTNRVNQIRATLANNQPIAPRDGGILAAAAARIKSALGFGQ